MLEIPATKRHGVRILDIPAGRGVVAIPLRAAGFEVLACDLFPEYLQQSLQRLGGQLLEKAYATFRRGRLPDALGDATVPTHIPSTAADMEGGLPFPDHAFDYIICMEGIEHVTDRHNVLAEFRRILKPGGRLLLSTPNTLCLRARVAFAFAGQRTFTGYLDEFTGIWGRSADGKRIYHGHAFLIDYHQLRYSLYHCGFKIRSVLPSNRSNTSVVLLPFLLPWIALFTWRSQRAGSRKFAELARKGEVPPGTADPYPEIRHHVLSLHALLSTVLIVEAEAF